jgi:putative SOS response-associated peptidase YedK
MCNIYSLNKKRDMVARFFRVSHNRTAMFQPASAIFPKHVAPVVRLTADGEREITMMTWRIFLLGGDRRACASLARRLEGKIGHGVM